MNKHVKAIIDAHGGLERWQQVRRVRATLNQAGALWALKGKGGVLDHTTVTVATDHQWASHAPFGDVAARSDFTAGRIALLDGDDAVVAAADEPRALFGGHTLMTPWDDLQLAFFAGCAMWTYLNMPFLLAWDGVEVEDAGDWMENGETWRKLTLRFPDTVEVFSKAQAVYVGDDHLVRRLDYDVEIAGDTPGAHYVSDYVTVDGLAFPTRRRIFPRGDDGHAVPDPLVVEIDLADIQLERA
jgi:hypothetical protein